MVPHFSAISTPPYNLPTQISLFDSRSPYFHLPISLCFPMGVIAHDYHDYFTLFFYSLFYSFSLPTYLLTHTFIYFFLFILFRPTNKHLTLWIHGTVYDTRQLLV